MVEYARHCIVYRNGFLSNFLHSKIQKTSDNIKKPDMSYLYKYVAAYNMHLPGIH